MVKLLGWVLTEKVGALIDATGKSIYSYTHNGIVKGAGYMNMTAQKMIIKYGLK